MPVRDYFSEADLAAVREATHEAESRTAGELVCVSNLETVVDGMRVRSVRDDAPVETDEQREARL